MTELPEFRAFRKIPRLNRSMTVTEKVDGANAAVVVTAEGQVYGQARRFFVTAEKDVHGFYGWIRAHAEELLELGPGVHYGEWFGHRINRGYGLLEKRFALFNVDRWSEERPACCQVVPVIARSTDFDSEFIDKVVEGLRERGSHIVPGYLNPEGIVVRHDASGHLYKVTLEGDDVPKGLAA